MAVIPCPNKIDCPGTDFPVTNYSAEGPEQLPSFFSLYFPTSWDRFGCLALCESTVSQNEADLCALAQAAACLPPPNNPCPIPPCLPPIFCNTAQTCSCVSLGGSESFYTTPAGTFCAETQAAADALAHAYACQHCSDPTTSTGLVAVDACVCYGVSYTERIATTGVRPIGFIIVAGALPLGLVLDQSSGVISGTAAATGQFSFTIRTVGLSANYAQRTYSISVIVISTAALTEFELGVPYSFQLAATGGSGNYSWKVQSGTLPTGIVFDSSGLLSGTPTALNSSDITFAIIDLACESVNRTFFTPRVRLVGHSRTTIATLLGYSEFRDRSTPPKKYKRITWNGYSEQRAVTWPIGASSDFLTGLARYEWSGYAAINDAGALISQYTKNYFAPCANEVKPFVIDPLNRAELDDFTSLKGYCWGPDPNSCACPWPHGSYSAQVLSSAAEFISNNANPNLGNPLFDDSDFALSGMGNADRVSSTLAQKIYNNPNIAVVLNSGEFFSSNFVTNFPKVVVEGYFGSLAVAWVVVSTDNNYSATLSDEYTDATALANAFVYTGNGLVAESRPRTTGFVSKWTTVAFDLVFSNLTDGEDYTSTVFFQTDAGVVTSRTYNFTSSGTTHTISDTCPTPPDGHSVVVRSANVSYSG